jgi:hypothetical protein
MMLNAVVLLEIRKRNSVIEAASPFLYRGRWGGIVYYTDKKKNFPHI